MKHKDKTKFGNLLSYVDMLFALLIGVFSIFIISTMLLGSPQKTGKIDDSSTLMIQLTWDDQSADDMDLWCKGPDGGDPIGYSNRENTYMSLDRDDLGVENDYTEVNGQKTLIRHNEEDIRIRTLQPGHYSINVMFYARKQDPERKTFSVGPQTVTVKMFRVNPAYSLVYARTFTIQNPGDVGEAFNFDVEADKVTVDNVTTNPENILDFLGHHLPDQEANP